MANSANPEINKKIATSALGTLFIATVFFYLGDRYAETLVTYPGQIFDHLGDAMLAMWQTIKDAPFALDMTSNSLLFGGACFLIIWMIWLRYVAFIGNYRSGEESGSARWGTLKEGKKFKDLQTEDNNLLFTKNFGLALHRPKFDPEYDRKALKGDLYSVGKKGTHGAGSTALDAIARKRKKTSAADALDGKSRSQLTGKNALTKKVQSRHNLNKSLKRGAKGVAAKAAHNALKDSELEGTDDLVATTHTGAKLAGKARKHLRSGKDALEKKDSLGALSEKKYRTEKLDKKAAQKRMQFSKYFHRNVYENAAAQAGKKKALTILSGGIKGMLSSLAGAVSQFFPLIIAFILAFGLISVVGGGAADEEQKSASLDGMPAWVTYDLVLACLNAHEQ